jgi:hypothetical protein
MNFFRKNENPNNNPRTRPKLIITLEVDDAFLATSFGAFAVRTGISDSFLESIAFF